MKNLLIRAVTGALFVALILGSIFADDLIATSVFGLFMALGLMEFYLLFKKHNSIEISWQAGFTIGLLSFGVLTLNLYSVIPSIGVAGLILIPFIIMGIELWRNKKTPLTNAALLFMGLVYVVVPFFLITMLNYMDFNKFEPSKAFPLVAGMFILIWSNDTFAYLTGRLIGKTKLFERISPNKTWEGTIGGIAFTVLAGYFIAIFTNEEYMFFWMVSALIISPAAIIGDLAESMIKRSLAIKDSGNILPGHGGILDRFDAMLFAAPFFMVWTLIYPYI